VRSGAGPQARTTSSSTALEEVPELHGVPFAEAWAAVGLGAADRVCGASPHSLPLSATARAGRAGPGLPGSTDVATGGELVLEEEESLEEEGLEEPAAGPGGLAAIVVGGGAAEEGRWAERDCGSSASVAACAGPTEAEASRQQQKQEQQQQQRKAPTGSTGSAGSATNKGGTQRAAQAAALAALAVSAVSEGAAWARGRRLRSCGEESEAGMSEGGVQQPAAARTWAVQGLPAMQQELWAELAVQRHLTTGSAPPAIGASTEVKVAITGISSAGSAASSARSGGQVASDFGYRSPQPHQVCSSMSPLGHHRLVVQQPPPPLGAPQDAKQLIASPRPLGVPGGGPPGVGPATAPPTVVYCAAPSPLVSAAAASIPKLIHSGAPTPGGSPPATTALSPAPPSSTQASTVRSLPATPIPSTTMQQQPAAQHAATRTWRATS